MMRTSYSRDMEDPVKRRPAGLTAARVRLPFDGEPNEGGRGCPFRASACAADHQVQGTVMAKSATIKIRLQSTADTGFFYVTRKNPRNHTEKFTFRKYDPIARKHVEFKEAKIK